jgi:hypothetical protein
MDASRHPNLGMTKDALKQAVRQAVSIYIAQFCGAPGGSRVEWPFDALDEVAAELRSEYLPGR